MFDSEIFFLKFKIDRHLGLSANYEQKKFRTSRLSSILIEALPDFALKHSAELPKRKANLVARLKRSAKLMYTTKKFLNRGEIGELLLHVLMRDIFKTSPAISKIFYKDSANDTVKGFDAVHVKVRNGNVELWIGESKIYQNPKRALRSLEGDLKTHFKSNFLRNEFLFVTNKIDEKWPHKKALKKLLSENTSLDKVFTKLNLVCMAAYDCGVTKSHQSETESFRSQLQASLDLLANNFAIPKNLAPIEITLVLVPLQSKLDLLKAMDKKIKTLQTL